MVTVGIYRVGYVDLDVRGTCGFLNRCQRYFAFVEGGAITTMGDPDLSSYGYSDRVFTRLLALHSKEHPVMVAVTSVPIEDNYFTRTIDDPKLIIITAFQSEEILKGSGRSPEERLAVALCAELLSFEFQRATGLSWRTLFHQDLRGCLFDFVGIKSQAIAKLRGCEICQPCKGKLAESNMDTRILQAVNRILSRIRKPSFGKALSASISSPMFAFAYGGIVVGAAVNLVSGVLLANEPLRPGQMGLASVLVLGVPLFPVVVYAWFWIAYFRSRLA
jgi:hypothetical protein